jgi:hypothetical protein
MIGYVTVGTNDLPRAAVFYDALLAHLGAKRFTGGDASLRQTLATLAASAGPCQPFTRKRWFEGEGCPAEAVA